MNNNFLADLYGSEQKNNTPALIVGGIQGILGILCIYAIISIQVDTFTNIFRLYIAFFLLSVSSFSISSYFFCKKQNSQKFKTIKYIAFIFSLLFLGIAFLPVTILEGVSQIIKFNNLIPHFTKYILSIFVPMIISLFVWVIIYIVFSKVIWLNESTLASLISFFVWRFGSWLIITCYHKSKRNLLNDEDYISIKKDLYISVFVFITLFTLIANCINFSEEYSYIVKGITNAFAIYIAFDRLFGKWDKANKELEANESNLNL